VIRRLLFIYAHPDDESFGVAGIARMYADRGGAIAIVTATRGDAGRAGEPPICSREESINRHFFDLPDVDKILSVETFRQGFGPALSKRPVTDLFESLY
jgi:LmbE family N-acetylglucosaminyl deacetylase